MAIALGKDGSAPPVGTDIISATYVEECTVIDVTNRSNNGGASGAAGYRAFSAGLPSKLWEIECHDPAGLITSLEANTASSFTVFSVNENAAIDGVRTFTVTLREQ